MNKPQVGETVQLFHGDVLKFFRVQEWRGNKCFMSSGHYFVWSDTVGFRF